MKADSHKVRVTFQHGNAMSLDLKGCGSIYIEPYKEYFFENAPMQFINYLAQLRRLGVTYRLTNDKKGCYMTIDLTGYQTNEPKTILGQLRSNLVSQPPKITRPTPSRDVELDESTVEDLIPRNAFPEDIKEITLPENIVPPIEESSTDITNQLTEDDLEDASDITSTQEKVEEPIKVESTQEKVEEVSEPITEELLVTMNKSKLIETAKSLGLTDVSEIWTKKELRVAILDKLAK